MKSRSLFTSAASPRTLSLAASPSRLVKGWWVASSYPACARILASCPAPHRAGEKDASLRLLQPTLDTSTQRAVRLPTTPASRHEAFRPRRARLAPILRRPPNQACARPAPTGESRVELRLTATLQLQLRHIPQAHPVGAKAPSVRLIEHSLVLVELDRAPPNRASRRGFVGRETSV
jgi:hypothetical protein